MDKIMVHSVNKIMIKLKKIVIMELKQV